MRSRSICLAGSVLFIAALLGCGSSSNSNNGTGTGGKGGGGAGGGGSGNGGAGGGGTGNGGAGGGSGNGGAGGGGSGNGGTSGGSGADAAAGSGGGGGSGADAAAGSGGGTGTDARVDTGGADTGPLAGTAARPLLNAAQAAQNTVLKYLAQAGSVTAPLVDNWDPTAGVDISNVTPTSTVGTGGNFATVQAAISAATGTARTYIRVLPGTYRELVCVPTGAPPITLYSTETAAANQPVIVFNNIAGITPATTDPRNTCTGVSSAGSFGTDGSATVAVYGSNFQAKNLIISNDADEATATAAPQAVALHTRGDKLIFDTVRLLGNQDTILVKTPNVATIERSYFKNCYVEGDVDFICGRGTAVFDGGEIRSVTNRRTNGNVLAPATDARNPYGILVNGATFTGAAGATGFTLGRAWDESQGTLAMFLTNVGTGVYTNGQAVVRGSTLGAHINGTAPWAAAATTSRPYSSTAGTYPANRLYEYMNTGP